MSKPLLETLCKVICSLPKFVKYDNHHVSSFQIVNCILRYFRIGVLIQNYVNDSAHAFQVCWCKLPCHKISSSLSLTKNKLGMKLLFNCYITTITGMSSMRCLVIHYLWLNHWETFFVYFLRYSSKLFSWLFISQLN